MNDYSDCLTCIAACKNRSDFNKPCTVLRLMQNGFFGIPKDLSGECDRYEDYSDDDRKELLNFLDKVNHND